MSITSVRKMEIVGSPIVLAYIHMGPSRCHLRIVGMAKSSSSQVDSSKRKVDLHELVLVRVSPPKRRFLSSSSQPL